MNPRQCTYERKENLKVKPIFLKSDLKKIGPSQKIVLDYYPYGKVLREYINTPEKYLTTHHERDEETGLDYRGARMYDSDVARFQSLDPLQAKFPAWSAYNYVMGNPIRFIDPDGKSPWEPVGEGQWKAEEGDGAWSLSKDAKISYEEAKRILNEQGMGTYVDVDGQEKSAVDKGDIVKLPFKADAPDGTNPKKIEKFENKIKQFVTEKQDKTGQIMEVSKDIKRMSKEFGDNGPDPGAGRKAGQAFNILRKENQKAGLQKDTSELGGKIRAYQDSIRIENEK